MKQHIIVALFGAALVLAATIALADGPPAGALEAEKNVAQSTPPAEVLKASKNSPGCPALQKKVPVSTLSPDQQTVLKKLTAQFNAEAKPLRLALWNKHNEFKTLAGGKSMDKEKLGALITDMQNIQKKLEAMRDRYRAEIRKLDIDTPFGPAVDCPATSTAPAFRGQGGKAGYAKFGGSGPRSEGRGYTLGPDGSFGYGCPAGYGPANCPKRAGCPQKSDCAGCPRKANCPGRS